VRAAESAGATAAEAEIALPPSEPVSGDAPSRWAFLRKLAPFATVLLFGGALWLLHEELAGFRYRAVTRYLSTLPPSHILLSIVLTALGYAAMTGYDALAFRNIRHPLPYRRIALASFSGYAFSNSLGHPLFTGTPIRARLYSGWGLSVLQVTQVVLFCFLTFWLGFLTLGGATFLLEPLPLPRFLGVQLESARPLGALFLVAVVLYLMLAVRRRKPILWKGVELPLPGIRLALGQVVLSCLDWGLAGAVLYALLPPPAPGQAGLSFTAVLAAFLLSQLFGVLSQVPAGLGVFESAMLLLLTPRLPAPVLLGALVAYRGIYYFIPLLVASLLLAGNEVLRRRHQVLRLARGVGMRASSLVPQVLSLTTFLGGALLLVSGATPAVRWRLNWLDHLLPLPVIELSHFVGSLAGVALLLLAVGLQRRLDAAYQLTVGLLATGIVVSLLKGLDYEEAIALGLMLAALVPCHRHFYRKAALTNEPFTPAWIAAIAIVVCGAVWLGFFSYKYVQYSDDLWWTFTLKGSGNASRFLRATVGVGALALGFALWRLLRAAPHKAQPLTEADLRDAARIAAGSPRTYAYLALLGDKQVLFNEPRTAFLMYGVEHRSWVALGDPVGPEAERAELAWQFREICDQHGGLPVFYQVSEKRLHLYVDLGLSLIKLGEEARVPLATFDLLGRNRKKLRHAHRRSQDLGFRCEVHPASEVTQHLPELERISAAWLKEKSTREKGFSLGFFDPNYLERLPIALVRGPEGEIVAFANIWPGAPGEEVSIDLMRHTGQAPPGIMDYLFVELMLWGRQQGYGWFNLGMAPFSGLEGRTIAPLWSRLGTLVFRHGEHFYNFQGLRSYKDKFEPVWEPRYLACPGGLALPRVLADVASLVSGGYRGVIAK